MTLGALILTGGGSTRMGEDKAAQLWGGRRAVDLLTDLARNVGATAVLTVGRVDLGLPRVGDETPDGGPVAGIAAGVKALRAAGCDRALVLPVDTPTLTPEDLAPLLTAPPPGAAYKDLHLPMVIDLAAVPPEAAAGWRVSRLIELAGLARPPCPPAAQARLRGANTPAEREALLAELSGRSAPGG